MDLNIEQVLKDLLKEVLKLPSEEFDCGGAELAHAVANAQEFIFKGMANTSI